jgi:hypothetical protein
MRLSQRYGGLHLLQPEAMPTTPHAFLADLTIQMVQKDMQESPGTWRWYWVHGHIVCVRGKESISNAA